MVEQLPTTIPFRINRFSADASKWAAICNRDPTADGQFVYLVKTTKIYCRPVCKARLARRSNVSFYDTALEAEAEGYRPCKRCQPKIASTMPEDEAVRKIRLFVAQSQPDLQLSTVDEMAKKSGLSKWHFHRVFRRTIGLTPKEYARLY